MLTAHAGKESLTLSIGSKEQKLKHVTRGDRKRIQYATSTNRRLRAFAEAARDAKVGPHCCQHCSAEPCGGMWPFGACCHRCTHLPMPGWVLTHVLWYRKKPFYVMEVTVRRPGEPTERERAALAADRDVEEPSLEERQGIERKRKLGTIDDAIYYRWDGVSQWTRRARSHYFLGVRVTPLEFLRMTPNEQEIRDFAPRERPWNPFEEGMMDAPGDEVGEPFRDGQAGVPEPGPTESIGRYFDGADGEPVLVSHGKVKLGFQFVDPDEGGESNGP